MSGDRAPQGRRRRRWFGAGRQSSGIALAQFAAGGIAALALLALVGVTVLRSAAVDEGVKTATAFAGTQTRFVVQPALTDALVAGDPAAIAAFDQTVRSLLIQPGVARIKLWDAQGRVVYSDDRRLIGQRFALAADDVEALRTGVPSATLVDVRAAENVLERDPAGGPLLQVYSRVTSPAGVPLLYEVYFWLDAIAAPELSNVRALIPALILALIALEVFQLPLAWRLAHRLQRSQEEREALHRKALAASDNERRRIARDLHDGLVQSLAGVSYSLAAIGESLVDVAPSAAVAEIARAADVTRDGVGALRTLIMEIYPPNLELLGLNAALTDLMAPIAVSGFETWLDLPDDCPLSPAGAAVFYRAAQECVRNAVTHSGASSVALSLAYSGGTASLLVRDNGVGFDPAGAREDDGRAHFGLLLVGELAAEVGGRMDVESSPGAGTTIVVEIPIT